MKKINKTRRLFSKLFGVTIFSYLLLPYKFLYSATKKIINKNLTEEQKKILFNEGTERPFTSSLLNEKREGYYHCANCGAKLFSSKAKFDKDKYINELRFQNELVRHKTLDLFGDCWVINRPIKGHIIGIKSGHSLTAKLVKELNKLI